MKDLFVFTADADALAVMRAVLSRPESLGIRPITFDVDRHAGKDSAMVRTGPQLAGMRKGRYRKAVLIWDFHGSGWENVRSPQESEAQVQAKLDQVTWRDNSEAVAIVPELEEWLWHNQASIHAHLGVSAQELDRWVAEYATSREMRPPDVKASEPKELLEYVFVQKARRTISPADFEAMASRASLVDWKASPSFRALVALLATWFPK